MPINQTVSAEPVVTVTAGAYSDGDVVGGLLNLSELAGSGGGGTIRQILLVDDAAQSANIDVYFFDGEPSTVADNAAFASAMTAADLAKLVGVVSLSSYTTLNSNTYAVSTDVNLSHGTGELYAYLVLNGSTPTYAATTDIMLKVVGWVD